MLPFFLEFSTSPAMVFHAMEVILRAIYLHQPRLNTRDRSRSATFPASQESGSSPWQKTEAFASCSHTEADIHLFLYLAEMANTAHWNILTVPLTMMWLFWAFLHLWSFGHFYICEAWEQTWVMDSFWNTISVQVLKFVLWRTGLHISKYNGIIQDIYRVSGTSQLMLCQINLDPPQWQHY